MSHSNDDTVAADSDPLDPLAHAETHAVSGPPVGGPKPLAGDPTRIGKFVILRRLGQGGMGVVFAGYDEDLDRKVAVKLVHAERSGGTLGRQRLLREAQAMARLSHPNVVQVYEVGTFEDQVYVAMEFIKGRTLREWQSEPDRRWPEIVETYVEAAHGLAAAHVAGIVHRDFKPDNVLVGDDGRVCVLDFGLARSGDGEDRDQDVATLVASRSADIDSSARLTQTGAVMGTPAYMSPEQHRGGLSDARTDQFSFCVSLYEALYGERPFRGSTLAMLAHSVLEGSVVDAPRYTEVPGRLRSVLVRGLATRPEDRHESMDGILEALERDQRHRRLRRGWLTAGGVMAAVMVAVFGAWNLLTVPRVDLSREREHIERALERASFRNADRARDRAEVSEHWDALVLAYARTHLDRDPTKALAALIELTPENRAWLGPATTIAADALRRGVAAFEVNLGARGDIVSMAIDDDGDRLLLFDRQGRVFQWSWGVSVETSDTSDPHPDGPRFAEGAFGRDGSLVLRSQSGTVYLGSRLDDLHAVPVPGASAIAVSTDANLLWVGDEQGGVSRVDLDLPTSEVAIRRVELGSHGIRRVLGSSDGMAAVDAHGTVFRVRGMKTQPEVQVLEGAVTAPHALVIDPMERRLICAGEGGTVRSWSLADDRAESLSSLAGADALASGGDFLLFGAHGRSGSMTQVDGNLEPIRSLSLGDAAVQHVVVSTDGSMAASVDDRGMLRGWRLRLGLPERHEIDGQGLSRLVVSDDGNTVATGSATGKIRVWSVADGSRRLLGQHPSEVRALALSGDARFLASAARDPGVRVWSIDEGELSVTLGRGRQPTSALAWNPDGRTLGIGTCEVGRGCTIELHDVVGGHRTELDTNLRAPTQLHWSSDGNRVLVVDAADMGSHIHVWTVESTTSTHVQLELPGRDRLSPVVAVAFGAGDRAIRVATVRPQKSGRQQLRVWQWTQRGAGDLLYEAGGLSGVVGLSGAVLMQDEDRTVVWDLGDDELTAFESPPAPIDHAVLGPQGFIALRVTKGDDFVTHLVTGERRPLRLGDGPIGWGTALVDTDENWLRIHRDGAAPPTESNAFVAWAASQTDVRLPASDFHGTQRASPSP